MAVEVDPHPRELPRLVEVAHLRELEEKMGAVEDPADNLARGLGAIVGNVLTDVPQAAA